MVCFSDSPAEGRRSSFVVDVFDFLFLLLSLNWIDVSFLMFKKATQCRLLKPLVSLWFEKQTQVSAFITIFSCPNIQPRVVLTLCLFNALTVTF